MKKIICLLEDDQDIREILTYLFENENFEVLAFHCIRDLMSKQSHIRPDLFLLDVMLPDGNGIDLCKYLNNNETTKLIPVLLMSANTESKTVDVKCKAKGFISKPFEINNMISTVGRILAA